jgi:cell division protein FtsB
MRQKIPAGGGRSRRRRRQRSYFLQLALAASLVAAGAWLLVVVAEKVIHPYWLGHEVGQQVAQVREQVARQKARNAELRKQILFLRSEEGAEREARRRGFRRPGEEVYFFPEDRVQAAVPTAAPPPAPPAETNRYGR